MSSQNDKQTTLSSADGNPAKQSKNLLTNTEITSLQAINIGLRSILDQTGTYIFTKDTAGRYTYVNQMTQDLFGAPFEDIIGLDDSHFFDLELANELCLNDRRVIDLGELIEREETIIVKATGETRIYWAVKRPLRNDQGQIIGLCGISTDITQRKAIENALRQSEASLRLSQSSGGIGSWEADLLDNKQKWSENCSALLGSTFQDEQPTWDDFLNCIHPEDRQKVVEATRLHIESDVPYDVEYRVISSDGSIRWLRSAGQVERSKTGKATLMRGIVQNITERHDNQRRIEQLIAKQKAIVENQLVGICTTRDRKIVWANATFETMFGYANGELIGGLTRKLYITEDDFQFIGAAYSNIGDNEILRTQHEFVCKDGRHAWLDMSGTILHEETNEFLWIFVDATERRQAEAELENSLSLLHATLESTNDAILVVDQSNTWILHNQNFIDLWQITDEILAAKDDNVALTYVLDQLIDADAFLKKVIDLYATPETSSFDMLNFKNGKKIERYSIPQRIDDKVVGRVWSFRDVTERERINLALKGESEKNLALLHNASDGICILDFDGNSIEVSDSFCDMLGYQRNEIIGKNVAVWDATFSVSESLTVVRKQFEKPVRSQFETRHRRKDGTIYDVEVSGFPFELAGKPVLFNSSRDITERKRAEKQLVDSESKYRSLINLASDAIFLVDTISGIIIDCNKHAAELLGRAKNEIIGLHQTEIHPAEMASYYQEIFNSHVKSGYEITQDVLMIHKDGHTIPVDISASVIKLGDATFILAIFRDITMYKQKTDELNYTKKRYELATTIGKIGIWDWNCLNNDLVWNEETYRIFGLDVNTRPSYALYLSMMHKEDRKKIENAVHESLYEKKRYNENCRIILGNGEERICHTTGEVEYNEFGEPVRMLGTFQDISGQKKTEAELEHIAYHDALTRLPNRVLLADRLHQAMTLAHRSGQQLAVVFLDLDGFKTINDNYGHETGDQLLVILANRMKQTLREGDTLARLGGDEFVAVLLELEDLKSSVPMLNRLLSATAEPVHLHDLVLNVSASLGVTFYPQIDDIDADQLLRQSDQAMYQAKLGGKNRYHIFDATQDINIRVHHENVERIRYALSENEFVLYYQPKVNMRTGTVIGAEALIRWQHPQEGLLSPAIFLPVIEGLQLAVDIGNWVIDTVLSQLEYWQAAGLHLPVSINVSAHHLQQPDFVVRLQNMLASHPKVSPCSIELEILETSALEDLAGVSGVIEACRDIGILFALDDFGTGYSSLSYLKRLPVTLLKIDQSFVRDMLEDPDDLAILQGILGLAAAFHRDVIAEGVETIEHGQMLLQLGCDLAQGYGIAHPMQAKDMPQWVINWCTDPSWVNLSSLSRDDFPLLFASIEHLAWVSAIEKHLKDDRAIPPQMNQQLCNFGVWLVGHGLKRHGNHASFKCIVSIHTQMHVLATELLKHHNSGQAQEALARLTKLFDLRDLLIAQLKVILQGVQQ